MRIVLEILIMVGGATVVLFITFLLGSFYFALQTKQRKVCGVCYERFKSTQLLTAHYANRHPEFQREWAGE